DTQAYPVVPPSGDGAPAVIHSIQSVRMMHGLDGGKAGAEIPPHKSLQHWSSVGVFWLQKRKPVPRADRHRDRFPLRIPAGNSAARALPQRGNQFATSNRSV
ncbi:MAG TPA: hypothetical protein VF446_03215, partial [Trinickia sp.]